MAFAFDQPCQPSVIRLILSEQEPSSTKSFWTPSSSSSSSWISAKDALVEEFFAAASERPAKLSEALRIGHSMGSEQMLDVAPCTPLPSFSRHRAHRLDTTTDATPSPPSLCLSVGSSASQRGKGECNRSKAKVMASSWKPLSGELAANSSLKGGETSDMGLSGALSEAQAVRLESPQRRASNSEGVNTIARGLSIGIISREMEQKPKDSGSAMVFGAALMAGRAFEEQGREEKGNEKLREVEEGKKPVNAIQRNGWSKGRLTTNSIELHHGHTNPYVSSSTHFFSSKNDSEPIFISHPHLLPFAEEDRSPSNPSDFSIPKRMVFDPSASSYHLNGRGSPEKRCKLFSSGGTGMCQAVFHDLHSNGSEPSAGKKEKWSAQLQVPDVKMNVDLSKVKLEVNWDENITPDYKTSPLIVPKEVLKREDMHFTALEKQQMERKTESVESSATNKVVAADGDWGKFLALSATPTDQPDESCAKVAPPFQCRFKMLQEFLKECDEMDRKCDLEALQILTAAEIGSHAIVLETRAIKLSLEESRELDRMKALNVLGRSSGAIIKPQGP